MSNRKQKSKNRQIREKYEKQKLIEENPNTCFCDEPEYDMDKPIRETPKEYYSKYDWHHENPFSLPIYRCSKCGKEHILIVAQA